MVAAGLQCTCFLLLTLLVGVFSRDLTPEQIEQLESFTQTLLSCRQNVGITLALVREGETVYTNAMGYSEIDEQIPMTADTRVSVASISKSFTGLLVSNLIEQGLLDWDTPLQDILGPEFELEGEFRTTATMRDVLGHKLGMMSYFGFSTAALNVTREELCMRRLRHFTSLYEHRDEFWYSNYPFVLAGYVIEVLTGKSWEEQIVETIFEPCGMTNSKVSLDLTEEDWENTAYSYVHVDDEYYKNPEEDQLIFLTEIGPAGAVFSTAHDMAKYMKLHLSEGRNEADEEVLPSQAVRDIRNPTHYTTRESTMVQRPRFPVEDVRMKYGSGIFLGMYRGYEKIHHTGGYSSYISRMTLLPDVDIGVWSCANSPGDGRGSTAMRLLNMFALDLLLDEEPWLNDTTACTFPDPWSSYSEEVNLPKMKMSPIAPFPQRPLEEYEGAYVHPGFDTFTIYINQTTGTLYYRHGRLLNGELLPAEERDEFYMRVHYPLHYRHAQFPMYPNGYPFSFGTIDEDDEISNATIYYMEFYLPPIFVKDA